MFKNTASQEILVFAWTIATGAAKTGDAANITCIQRIDAAGSAVALTDTNPTENDATAEAGYYTFTLTQGETNGDEIAFIPKSSTSGVQVVAIPAVVNTEPYAQAGTLPAYNGSGMTVATAREWVRGAARDAGGDSSVYTDADVDRAIQEAGDYFCEVTKSIRRTDSVTITEGSTVFPTTAPIAAGWLPERTLDVWITTATTPLQRPDYQTVQQLLAEDAEEDVPASLAFIDESSNGLLWPTPDDDYTAKLSYWLPFTTWTPGSDDSTTLNIPTYRIKKVLTLGAAPILKAPSPEEAYEVTKTGQFVKWCESLKGAGNLGSRVTYRNRAVAFQRLETSAVPVDRPGADG